MLARLKSEGLPSSNIFAPMHEVEALADRALGVPQRTPYRNLRTRRALDHGIVQLMIGRDITTQYPAKPARRHGEAVLALENLSWEEASPRIRSRRRGEIVGLGGLDGQARNRCACLVRRVRGVTGRITVEGREVRPGSPAAAKSPAVGIALVPEIARPKDLMLPMSIADNLAIASLDAFRPGLSSIAPRSARRSSAASPGCRSRSRTKRCVSTLSAATSRGGDRPNG